MSVAPHTPPAKARALRFIASQQQADGSFISFSSPSLAPFTKKHAYTTVFTPAIILGSLTGLEDETAAKVRERLAEWLIRQKDTSWSFNYWAVEAPERKSLPFPDDLDDTFCALIGLYLHDQSLLGGSALAHIVKLLIATETTAGGPYRTWLVPKKSEAAWLDVDLAVNCNIGYFLSLVSNPLPNVSKLLTRAVSAKRFDSPYYPSEYPVLYYVARAYQGPKRVTLVQYILGRRQADGSWGTPLQTALMVSALCNLGHATDLESAKTYLLARQSQNGSWEAEAFCLDPAQGQHQYFSGAPALTTALVLEALQKLEQAEASNKTRAAGSLDKRASKIYEAVMTATQKQFSELGHEVSTGALALLERL
ncbi:MAG TPA: prenyltransferase/squalene oxidase repeat-containing protein, partial [Verrucomicrobiae bacterium]|nr:prenyltransferase/squalene oxidase repeat-containing protein [Verrucomicrobiae bacterium]